MLPPLARPSRVPVAAAHPLLPLPAPRHRSRHSVAVRWLLTLAAFAAAPLGAQDLLIDFNSTTQDGGPHHQAGYQPFNAGHEVPADFVAPRSFPAFGTTVSLLVSYPDTTDPRVKQMIDRGAGNDANYVGTKIDLITDWIGIDTRTGSGGNGSGVTTMTFTFTGLPAGTYQYRAFHHDTESVNGECDVAISDADGNRSAGTVHMTASTTPGNVNDNPANPGAGNDPDVLSSTATFTLAANGNDPVVIVYAMRGGANVHNQLFGVNGIELTVSTPPTGPTDIALAPTAVAADAASGTLVGTFSTVDPEPGDNFTYAFAAGPGDDHNDLFTLGGLDGEELRTAADLSALAGQSLSVRVRSTDSGGASVEKAVLVLVTNDADNDGLDDSWELSYFPDLATATGTGDNDGDGLDNAGEQARGTNPTRADTDNDGLVDALENGSGTFNGPDDPGSDPLSADTDSDGLPDGVEVSNANGSVTNPNASDTDGDNFPDPLEIAEGTDPNNPADFPSTLLPLRINEIMANNADGVRDGFNETSDWIEIHNPNAEAVSLLGYHLTDRQENLAQWTFPPVSVPANGFLVVRASGRDTTDPSGALHTNFGLDASGEFLALVRPDGTTIADALSPAFPRQFADISFGRHPTNDSLRYFSAPTPGAPNNEGYDDVVRDTAFSHDRGFYDAPIEVAITSATPGALIRFTTDGTKPTESNGTLYTAPVPVATTTTLRAFAYKPGALPTNIDTHTYLFVDDVLEQPAAPPGFPTNWGTDSEVPGTVAADYEMDQRVVDGAVQPGYTVRDALLAIPTMSIVLPIDDMFSLSSNNGLYTHPRNRGAAWERECSLELIHPDGTPGFQENCIVEMHGNSSRRPWRMQKHSFRVTFRAEVGASRLRYPLFPDSPVDEFNKLVLRACFTDSWGLVSWDPGRYRPNDSQYFRDVWMKESLRAMGNPSSYGNFVHLYVNGLYWGLHNPSERLEEEFFASHLGGQESDWVINADFSSPPSRWNQMMGINASTVEGYDRIREYVDVENFADYMLLHFYADAEDWPHHNGYAAANVGSGDGRFRFWVWDQEIVLDKHGLASSRIDNGSGAGALFQKLRQNPEFRLTFADRVRRHLFHDGALSLARSQERYRRISEEIDVAIVAESARWGDTQRSTPYGNSVQQPNPLTNVNHDNYPPAPNGPDFFFTREDSWLVERDNVIDNYLPAVHDTANSFAILNVLRGKQLYPGTAAPEFSQHGGNVPSGYQLEIAAPSGGTIFYTLDGSDPRTPATASGATFVLVPEDALKSVRVPVDGAEYAASPDWTEPGFDASSWPTGTLGAGYERSSGYIDFLDPNFQAPSANDLLPQLFAVNASLYTRAAFELPDPLPDLGTLTLGVRYDDGFVAYINGVEVARANAPGAVGQPVAWNAAATASHSDTEAVEFISVDATAGLAALRPGTNVLAIHGLNQGTNGSDMLIHATLTASEGGSTGGLSPSAVPYAGPIELAASGTVRARVLSGGEWSALTEATFVVGTPADATNLVVSEIMYNPPGTGTEEFIELLNISPTDTIDLTNTAFTAGIAFPFPVGTTLAPGQRVLVVRDLAGFEAVYGAGRPVAGAFAGALDNNGEQIVLTAADGSIIRDFRYNDAAPWPELADGGGYSIVLVNAGANPDHGEGTNWRLSAAPGGSPGTEDGALGFAQWMTDNGVADPVSDDEVDGLAAILEYVFGSDPNAPSPEALPTVALEPAVAGEDDPLHLTIRFRRNPAANEFEPVVEVSDSLADWRSGPQVTEQVGTINNPDGTVAEIHRSVEPVAAGSRLFIRVRVSAAP